MPHSCDITRSQIVLENHVAHHARSWRVPDQIDLLPKPVHFGQVGTIDRLHIPGEVRPRRVERDPRGVEGRVRGGRKQRPVVGDSKPHDVGADGVDELADGRGHEADISATGNVDAKASPPVPVLHQPFVFVLEGGQDLRAAEAGDGVVQKIVPTHGYQTGGGSTRQSVT